MTKVYDVAVLGAGPVGLACAITAARTGDVVLIDAGLGPRHGEPDRADVVEAVPAGLLHLLCDLGVDPARLCAEGPFLERVVAWDAPEPTAVEGTAAIHLARGTLERALESVVAASTRVTRAAAGPIRLGADVIVGPGWIAARVLDCTGRRASSAAAVHRAPRPWVATTWTFRAPGADRRFALAALSEGYCYRLGAGGWVTFGWVTSSTRSPTSWSDWLRRVEGALPDVMTADFRRVEPHRGPVRPASLQWGTPPEDPRVRLVGDSALARDALASSGLACGLADAVASMTVEPAGWAHRHRNARSAHAQLLARDVSRCCHAAAPAWRSYAAWLATIAEPASLHPDRALAAVARGI